MILTNKQIYKYAQDLNEVTSNFNILLPVRINFFLQKNIRIIVNYAHEIERSRLLIATQYGKLNESQNSYDILPENIKMVNCELDDLFNLEQDLPIHIFKLSDFDGIELTYQQMSAIMFMIEE